MPITPKDKQQLDGMYADHQDVTYAVRANSVGLGVRVGCVGSLVLQIQPARQQ